MPKKTSGRRKGVQRGVAKYKIRSKKPVKNPVDHEPEAKKAEGHNPREQQLVFWFRHTTTVLTLSQITYDYLFKICAKLYLIPFTKDATTFNYVLNSPKRKRLHQAVLLVGALNLIRVAWVCVELVLFYDVNQDTLLSISVFLINFVAWCCSFAVIAHPTETVDLLNSWTFILACLREWKGRHLSPFEDISSALKVLVLVVVLQGIAWGHGLGGLVLISLPATFMAGANRLGVIPQGVLPNLVWAIIFFPAELCVSFSLMISASFGVATTVVGIGVIRYCLDEIQQIPMRDLATRANVERLYICIQLHLRLFSVWVKFMLPPTLFGGSITVIVAMYVTIRHTDLPLILYIWFPTAAVGFMITIFGISYDILRVTRSSEAILSQLLEPDAQYLEGLSKIERVRIQKNSRALKPAVIPVGDFAEFSMSLPVNMWEEILNQLLFFLSL